MGGKLLSGGGASSLSSPSTLVPIVVLPPAVALLYAASVQTFLAVWHEREWTSGVRPILARAALVAASAVASSVGLVRESRRDGCGDAGGFGAGLSSLSWCAIPYSLGGTVLSGLSTIVSAWLLSRTRRVHVRGPRPKVSAGSMAGRVVLITGANAGIGYETARQLFEAGATVVLGCRSEERGRDAMERILVGRGGHLSGAASWWSGWRRRGRPEPASLAGAESRTRLRFLEVDVSDLSSVRTAAEAFRKMKLPLHVLILNAGVMMGERRISPNGFELTMACNHLGHFLLTNLLLPLLRKEDGARVVTVTSSTYALARGGVDLNDLNCERRQYTLFSQYAQSKLANILFARELARREQGRLAAQGESYKEEQNGTKSTAPVASYAVHPGLVRTDVVRNMPWYLRYPNVVFGAVLATLQKAPEEGAYTSVWCAASNDVTGESGRYYVNSCAVPLEDCAMDDKAASELWVLSEKLVELK